MTKDQRQQSLIHARRACLLLADYSAGDSILLLGEAHREAVACLLEEFARLDANARRPQAGRKRSLDAKPESIARRERREKQKQ